MILFDGVWKFTGKGRSRVPFLAGVNCVFERRGNVVILCEREQDVNLLIRLVIGAEQPNRGRVIKRGTLSWPMGELVGGKSGMTIRDNLRFLARIHGVNENSLVEFVDEFVGLGKSLTAPYGSLNRTTKLVSSYAAALAIPFDWYIVRQDIRGASKEQGELLVAAFGERMRTSSALVITADVQTALSFEGLGVVFRQGQFHLTETVKDAARFAAA